MLFLVSSLVYGGGLRWGAFFLLPINQRYYDVGLNAQTMPNTLPTTNQQSKPYYSLKMVNANFPKE
jgi:hypothetical protein